MVTSILSLFPQCFQEASFFRVIKIWDRVVKDQASFLPSMYFMCRIFFFSLWLYHKSFFQNSLCFDFTRKFIYVRKLFIVKVGINTNQLSHKQLVSLFIKACLPYRTSSPCAFDQWNKLRACSSKVFKHSPHSLFWVGLFLHYHLIDLCYTILLEIVKSLTRGPWWSYITHLSTKQYRLTMKVNTK